MRYGDLIVKVRGQTLANVQLIIAILRFWIVLQFDRGTFQRKRICKVVPPGIGRLPHQAMPILAYLGDQRVIVCRQAAERCADRVPVRIHQVICRGSGA